MWHKIIRMLLFREVVPLRRSCKFFCNLIDEEDLLKEKVVQVFLPRNHIFPHIPLIVYKNRAVSKIKISWDTIPTFCSNQLVRSIPQKKDFSILFSKKHRVDTVFFFSQSELNAELAHLLDIIYQCRVAKYVQEVGFRYHNSLTLNTCRGSVYSLYTGKGPVTDYLEYNSIHDMHLEYECSLYNVFPSQDEEEDVQ